MKSLMALLTAAALMSSQAMAVTTPLPTEDKPVVMVQSSHPEFSIKLKSNPSTGYNWYLRGYDATLLQPVKKTAEGSTDKKLLGAAGYEIWTFRMKQHGFVVPMQTFIRFVYARSWEVNSQAKQVVFQVST